MKFGLVGWAIASGNGGMNSDIVSLADWVTHWLVPKHPASENHQPYLDKCSNKNIVECQLTKDNKKYLSFLESIDGLIYIEHPCLKDDFNIVLEAKRLGKVVVGIPMWEWWPERKDWALATDILWAVTKTTKNYLESLSNILYMHGWKHAWRNRVYGERWGVNLDDFSFRQRNVAERFVFINGNGGYKLRKASDIVFEAFSREGAPPLIVYSQKNNLANINSKNIQLIDKNFPNRSDVYKEGDVFIFTSYWEGLCHGIYEGQAVGGIVITTDHPPMYECGSPFLVPTADLLQEDLSGKKICKAVPSADALYKISSEIYQKDISCISMNGRVAIEKKFDLKNTLKSMHDFFVSDYKFKV